MQSMTGKEVEYVSGGRAERAIVRGIDDDCRIVLDIGGETKAFSDGEIRIRTASAD